MIAYKQPVTAPEVNEIRGVDSSGVFGSLLARKLIVTAGRKPVVGRPILYKTTREFLLRFGLKDVSELPSMEEFEKMAASELDEPELAQKAATADEVAPEFNPDPNLERDEVGAIRRGSGIKPLRLRAKRRSCVGRCRVSKDRGFPHDGQDETQVGSICAKTRAKDEENRSRRARPRLRGSRSQRPRRKRRLRRLEKRRLRRRRQRRRWSVRRSASLK